jgi:hypothetical protein
MNYNWTLTSWTHACHYGQNFPLARNSPLYLCQLCTEKLTLKSPVVGQVRIWWLKNARDLLPKQMPDWRRSCFKWYLNQPRGTWIMKPCTQSPMKLLGRWRHPRRAKLSLRKLPVVLGCGLIFTQEALQDSCLQLDLRAVFPHSPNQQQKITLQTRLAAL